MEHCLGLCRFVVTFRGLYLGRSNALKSDGTCWQDPTLIYKAKFVLRNRNIKMWVINFSGKLVRLNYDSFIYPYKISLSDALICGEIRDMIICFNLSFLDITERLEESWPEPTIADLLLYISKLLFVFFWITAAKRSSQIPATWN